MWVSGSSTLPATPTANRNSSFQCLTLRRSWLQYWTSTQMSWTRFLNPTWRRWKKQWHRFNAQLRQAQNRKPLHTRASTRPNQNNRRSYEPAPFSWKSARAFKSRRWLTWNCWLSGVPFLLPFKSQMQPFWPVAVLQSNTVTIIDPIWINQMMVLLWKTK